MLLCITRLGRSKRNLLLKQPNGGYTMDPFDNNTLSFIIKIWLEKTTTATGEATWRGHITHVPGRERSYLRDLDDITIYITPYLERMGVRFGIGWRMRRWRNRWKRQWKTRK